MPHFDAIFCVDKDGGIGKANTIPWHVKRDLQFFKEKTLNSTILMGRKTWESLPGLLKNRIHYVISSSFEGEKDGSFWFHSLKEALENAFKQSNSVYFIGGYELFLSVIKHPYFRYLYLTQLNSSFQCEVSISSLLPQFILKEIIEDGIDENTNISYRIGIYKLQK